MLTCPDFSDQHIIVVGDVMLDQYWHGDTSRISPEAPVAVVKIERDECRVGGAANVAWNVQTLGVQTTLMGVVGNDDAGRQLTKLMCDYGIDSKLMSCPDIKTVLKLRIIGRNQQLIRLDFEDPKPLADPDFLRMYLQSLESAQLVILSDYAKGVLASPQQFIQAAKARNIPVLVDPKHRDLSVYRGATILTPNLSEFELAVGPLSHPQDLAEKGYRLIEALDLEALLVTQGSQGMTLLERNKAPLHIPTIAKEVFDITGAGDTVIAVLGAVFATARPLSEAAVIANHAAGLSVGRLGTAAITRSELEGSLSQSATEISPIHTQKKVIPHAEALQAIIDERKRKGQTVIMTNGCFDILHAGHVNYLESARALGDCLIIAVNTDESVQQLKGPWRPINGLENRMALLAALGCVDYVIPFAEETPEKLISQILPNVLVKGGDYTPDQVAGGKAVVANGGEVRILPFVEGLSTTKTLEKLTNANRQEEKVV